MDWMAWTLPTSLFFVAVGLMFVGMTVWQVLSPSVARRGFLPMETTRGDRLFIGLLGSGFVSLAGIGFTEWASWTDVIVTLIAAALYLVAVMRWG